MAVSARTYELLLEALQREADGGDPPGNGFLRRMLADMSAAHAGLWSRAHRQHTAATLADDMKDQMIAALKDLLAEEGGATAGADARRSRKRGGRKHRRDRQPAGHDDYYGGYDDEGGYGYGYQGGYGYDGGDGLCGQAASPSPTAKRRRVTDATDAASAPSSLAAGGRKVVFSGLGPKVTLEDVRELAEQAGPLQRPPQDLLRIPGGAGLGIASVVYQDLVDAQWAVRRFNGEKLDGVTMSVYRAGL